MPDLSSLPARVDPTDWLDEELPTIARHAAAVVPDWLDSDEFTPHYSLVAELDTVDVAERAGVTPLSVSDDDWDAELVRIAADSVKFRICQNKLNR